MLGRDRSVERATASGLMIPDARRRWTEKFLTLTAPHCSEHSVGQRIEMSFDAWELFLKSLNRWFLEKAGADKSFVAWFRSFEWTPGRDGRGHPHHHVWLLCPYIEVPAIEHFWTCALRTSGYTKQSTRRVIIKLKKVWTGDGAARELIKYMTKDILPDRSHVAPDVFGRVYEAVDGKRLTHAHSAHHDRPDRSIVIA
jgi:hypothetical protein